MYDNTVDVGSVLTCGATGFPPPTFSWSDVFYGNVTSGSQYVVRRLGSNVVSCTARNVVRGVVHVDTLRVAFNATGLRHYIAVSEKIQYFEISVILYFFLNFPYQWCIGARKSFW